MPPSEQAESFAELRRALSATRLESYRRPGASDEAAVRMYFWNAAISEALFPMLQQLEVAFRNTLHRSIGAAWSESQWLKNGLSLLDSREIAKVNDARQSLIGQKKPVTEDDLVGELNFGFWTSLSDSRYDRYWPRFIKAAFPHCLNSMRTRDEISARANKLRKLRNAVFHHHSIWHWRDVEQHHRDGMALLSWISPELARITKGQDRFPEVFTRRP